MYQGSKHAPEGAWVLKKSKTGEQTKKKKKRELIHRIQYFLLFITFTSLIGFWSWSDLTQGISKFPDNQKFSGPWSCICYSCCFPCCYSPEQNDSFTEHPQAVPVATDLRSVPLDLRAPSPSSIVRGLVALKAQLDPELFCTKNQSPWYQAPCSELESEPCFEAHVPEISGYQHFSILQSLGLMYPPTPVGLLQLWDLDSHQGSCPKIRDPKLRVPSFAAANKTPVKSGLRSRSEDCYMQELQFS